MRLVGATPRQVALAAATEAAAAAAVGGLAGLALALLLRTRAADVAVAGYSTFPADLSPPLWQIGLVLIATPVLAAAAALGSMRRVAVTPLGVRRRQVPGRPSARRLIPLAVAWVELAVAVQMGDRLTEDGKLAALGVGFAGVILGIVIAGPWLVGALASAVAGGARGPGALIAGRRLQASPATAFRAVGGAVLGVFAATAVLVYLPSHDRWAAAGEPRHDLRRAGAGRRERPGLSERRSPGAGRRAGRAPGCASRGAVGGACGDPRRRRVFA